MPTENLSSNTDPRDVFIRLNPLGLGEEELRKDSTGFEDQRPHSDYLLFLAGYRETHPEPLQHTEPIAWMVGTAFWRTREEAERDAAATGLPIVGLGPMINTGEAEQLREDLAKYIARANDFASKMQGALSQAGALEGELAECAVMSAMVAEQEWAEHIGTGDVSSKVEAAFTQLHNDLHEASEKLAERDALLRDVRGAMREYEQGCDQFPPFHHNQLMERIDAALPASAEQEARS